MDIEPIAFFRSPLKSKFGVPRQSGIAAELTGTIVMTGQWNDAECLRGLEDFDYLWLLWGFSENVDAQKHATVRPPRLGGNRRMGVFATRSSFRPNNIGLSSVRILKINALPGKDIEIEVAGADLMDGTPIYDIKPYLPQFDAHPDASAGFTDTHEWKQLKVIIPEDIRQQLGETRCRQLREILAEDPRPQYHDSQERVYGLPFDNYDIKFRVVDNSLIIIHIDLL